MLIASSLREAPGFQLRHLGAQLRVVAEGLGGVGHAGTVRRADMLVALAHRVVGVQRRHSGVHPPLGLDDQIQPAEQQLPGPVAGFVLVLTNYPRRPQLIRGKLAEGIGIDARTVVQTDMLLAGAHAPVSFVGRQAALVHPPDEFLLDPRLGEVVPLYGIALRIEEEFPLVISGVFNQHS